MKKDFICFLTGFSLFICLSPLTAYGELKLGVNAKGESLRQWKNGESLPITFHQKSDSR